MHFGLCRLVSALLAKLSHLLLRMRPNSTLHSCFNFFRSAGKERDLIALLICLIIDLQSSVATVSPLGPSNQVLVNSHFNGSKKGAKRY